MKNNNLDTLKILYVVKGVLTILFSFFPLIYVFIGAFLGDKMNNPSHGEAPPFDVSYLLIGLGSVFFVLILIVGILTLISAKFIGQRKNYGFVFAVAILTCFGGMLSIALGVFSIIELVKPEVKSVFGKVTSDELVNRS